MNTLSRVPHRRTLTSATFGEVGDQAPLGHNALVGITRLFAELSDTLFFCIENATHVVAHTGDAQQPAMSSYAGIRVSG